MLEFKSQIHKRPIISRLYAHGQQRCRMNLGMILELWNVAPSNTIMTKTTNKAFAGKNSLIGSSPARVSLNASETIYTLQCECCAPPPILRDIWNTKWRTDGFLVFDCSLLPIAHCKLRSSSSWMLTLSVVFAIEAALRRSLSALVGFCRKWCRVANKTVTFSFLEFSVSYSLKCGEIV